MDNNILQQILYKLGRIESKLDNLNGSVKNHDTKIDALQDDCGRLEEKFKPVLKAYNKLTSFSFGVIVFVGSIIGGVIYFLINKFK